MKKVTIVSVLFLISLLFNTALAEDEVRGRLPDGRAFRTDLEGNQLVDYIAELEVSIEGLNRRVHGLEDELTDKNNVIAKLGGAEAVSKLTAVSERDIGPGKVDSEWTESTQPKLECPKVDCPSAQDPTQLIQTIEQLKQTHARAIENYQTQLMQLQSELDSTRRLKEVELSKLRNELEGKVSEVGTVRARFNQAAEATYVKEDGIAESVGHALESESRADQSGLSDARDRAVESVRSGVLTELNSLKGVIATRDSLFREYRGKSVKLSPSPARSSRDESIDDLTRKIKSARSIYELSVTKRELSRIRVRMDDDIALVKRMSRLG